MQVTNSSALQYDQLGMQRSQQNLDRASAQVAQASTETQSVAASRPSADSGDKIREGLVDANVSELQAKANANVIGTADDMLGTIIDIKA